MAAELLTPDLPHANTWKCRLGGPLGTRAPSLAQQPGKAELQHPQTRISRKPSANWHRKTHTCWGTCLDSALGLESPIHFQPAVTRSPSPPGRCPGCQPVLPGRPGPFRSTLCLCID